MGMASAQTSLCRLGLLLTTGFIALAGTSCGGPLDGQERLVSIPVQAWTHQYQPWVHLQIQDSTVTYRIYAVIRHNQQFKYDNLLLRYGYIAPGDSIKYQEVNLPLAKNGHWLGDTLGGIIKTRIRLANAPSKMPVGDNVFVLGHLMPDEPLVGVLQMGIRIEPSAQPFQTELKDGAEAVHPPNPPTVKPSSAVADSVKKAKVDHSIRK